MRNHFSYCLFSLTLFFSLFSVGKSAVSPMHLGAPFRDNAVLQRGMRVPVGGWAEPGVKVTVAFAGQTSSTVTSKSGKWMLSLDPLNANSKPSELKISESTGRSVTLQNILVGEVWLASGQSNMQWKVNKSSALKLAQVFTDQTQGQPAPIREFEVNSVFSMLHPIEKADGAWKNGEYSEYSAIAFAFAHKLYKELGVPIGILNCSFSQTAIQAWVPREGFRDGKDEYTRAIYRRILETDPSSPEHRAVWQQFYKDIEDTIREISGLPMVILPNRSQPRLPETCRETVMRLGYSTVDSILLCPSLFVVVFGTKAMPTWAKDYLTTTTFTI